jgi:hypothetical protein
VFESLLDVEVFLQEAGIALGEVFLEISHFVTTDSPHLIFKVL